MKKYLAANAPSPRIDITAQYMDGTTDTTRTLVSLFTCGRSPLLIQPNPISDGNSTSARLPRRRLERSLACYKGISVSGIKVRK